MDMPPPPPPAPPPPPPPPPPPAPAAKGSNRTLIIILCIVGAILLLIGGCVYTCAHFVRRGIRKAQQYSEEAQRNPQLAAISLAASLHPDIQIVSKDEAAGKITLRNKKTGEVVTLDVNELSSEKMGRAMEELARGRKSAPRTARAEEESEAEPAEPVSRSEPVEERISPARAAAVAATMKKFPDFIPVYRGGKTLEATLNTFGGNVVGNYSFSTNDAPETAADVYEKKLTDAGFTILTKQSGSNDTGPTVTLVAQHADPQTSVTCEAEIRDGHTRVVVSFVRAGGQ